MNSPDMWYAKWIATPNLEDPTLWNKATRKDYRRNAKRYASDVTDKQWAIMEPMILNQGRKGGLACH